MSFLDNVAIRRAMAAVLLVLALTCAVQAVDSAVRGARE